MSPEQVDDHASDGHGRDADERGGGRTAAERTSFAICAAVLTAVLALLVSQLLGPSAPALPVAEVAAVRGEGPTSVVEVDVRNGGNETATDVQVSASLTIGEDVEEADIVVPFLGGGETEEVTFTFGGDPSDGELEVRVTSFVVP